MPGTVPDTGTQYSMKKINEQNKCRKIQGKVVARVPGTYNSKHSYTTF